jgi:YD repeat-containing protein
MLSFNDKNITYDNNGNMTSVTNACGTTNYIWDVRNRLIGIQGYKPDCSALSATFEYDALGRIEKTINGRTIQYVYDGIDK